MYRGNRPDVETIAVSTVGKSEAGERDVSTVDLTRDVSTVDRVGYRGNILQGKVDRGNITYRGNIPANVSTVTHCDNVLHGK